MSNRDLRAVAGAADAADLTFPALLTKYRNEIERALPRHVTPDRICRIALTAFRDSPQLRKCSPVSIFASVLKASQLGLEIGLNGRAYLVPYGEECQFIPGWKGLVELANRTGRSSVWTGAVFRGDQLEYQLGDSPFLKHVPGDEDDPEQLTHVYAIGRVKGSDWPIIEVWSVEKIRKHRDRFNRVGRRHYSYEHFEMYARKVPLLQVLKYLPTSAELETAVALNDAGEVGRQGLTIEGALTDYMPPSQPEGEKHETDSTQSSTTTDSKAPEPDPAAQPATKAPVQDDEPREGADLAPNRETVLAMLGKIQTSAECDAQLPEIMDLVRGIKDRGLQRELYAAISTVAKRFGKG